MLYEVPMMTAFKKSRYRYDALDLLVGVEPADAQALQRFYCREHLATELQGTSSQHVFQHDKHLLTRCSRARVMPSTAACWPAINNALSCRLPGLAGLCARLMHPTAIVGSTVAQAASWGLPVKRWTRSPGIIFWAMGAGCSTRC